jgi:hypothetical protein
VPQNNHSGVISVLPVSQSQLDALPGWAKIDFAANI